MATAGSWYNPATNGQGFLGEVLVDENDEPETMITYWFTWNNDAPAVKFEGEEQRWFVAAGPIEDGVANMALTITTGGVFDDPESTETVTIGSLQFMTDNCTEGKYIYDINQNVDPDDMVSGEIDVVRLTPTSFVKNFQDKPNEISPQNSSDSDADHELGPLGSGRVSTFWQESRTYGCQTT